MSAKAYTVEGITEFVLEKLSSFNEVDEALAELLRRLIDEFEEIEGILGDMLNWGNIVPVLYNPPDRPKDGMVVIADGTSWNPGSGAGMYYYYGGGWTFIA